MALTVEQFEAKYADREDPKSIVRKALELAIRNTNSRLYLLRCDADDVERSCLAAENSMYAAGMVALREL